VSDLQQRVQDAVDRLVESGAERGVQVAAYRHGELVVDAVAGVADPATGRPVTSATVFYPYSVGKAMTSTVTHVLAERGLFGYDTPIAELWPEFAAKGKQAATVRHAMNHTLGVPGIPADTTPEDLCDWHKMCAVVADAEPWWEPGTKVGYHAYTFGYVVGEVVRRATGKPISQVLLEEVATPLGVGDELYFGMPASEHGRLATLEDAPGSTEWLASLPPDAPMFKAGPLAVWPTAELGNRRDVLEADIPAGGKVTARAIARMYAALLGEVDGVRLLPPERLSEATAVSSSGTDELMGFPTRWALGYGVGGPGPLQGSESVFGVGGAGGTFAYADRATGTAFALTKNRLTGDFDASGQLAGIVAEAVADG
jgi:CubicO group peptidase (beta-lactamase class C family)